MITSEHRKIIENYDHPINVTPEFADAKGIRALYGLSRPHLYNLLSEGKIKSVCLRKPGALRGRRLYECASIREYLRQNFDEKSK